MPSSHFYVLYCGQTLAIQSCVWHLGVPIDNKFTSSLHFREAANITQRLKFMALRSLSTWSKAAFTLICCAIIRAHLEYSMGARTQNLIVNIEQLERVHRLAIRIVKHLNRVPYKERLRNINPLSLKHGHLKYLLNLCPNTCSPLTLSYFKKLSCWL